MSVLHWIIWVVAFSAPTLLLHELSHLVVVKMRGGTITSFKPWPHQVDGKWWLGRVTYKKPPSDKDTRWRHGSPILLSAPLAIILLACSTAWTPLIAWAAWEAIDFLNWWRGYFEIKMPFGRFSQPVNLLDGYKFRHFE